MRLSAAAFAICAFALATADTPLAAQAQTPPPDITVKLPVADKSLRDALGLVFSQAKVPFIIGNGVDGVVTVAFGELPLKKALDLLCQAASPELTYTRTTDGIYIVRVKEKATVAPVINVEAPKIPAPVVNVTNQIPQKPIMFTATTPIGEDPILTAIDMQLLNLDIERKVLETQWNPNSPEVVRMPMFTSIDQQVKRLHQARVQRIKLLESRKAKAKAVKSTAPAKTAKN
jgi:hypothetical protein